MIFLLTLILTYLPHPNPCFALGSGLDRQSFPRLLITTGNEMRFAVIGLYYTHILPNENNFYNICYMLNFISVSFCTAYIIVTFRVRFGLGLGSGSGSVT